MVFARHKEVAGLLLLTLVIERWLCHSLLFFEK
jgi:hypothetical protein